jgi:SAM-dependent methyltransferase
VVDNSFPEQIWANRDFDDWGKGFWATTRVRIIASELESRSVTELLDVGSGNGELVSIPLTTLGFHVTCVEPLEAGASLTASRGITTYNSTLGDAPIPPYSVAAVGLFDVIEDAENEDDILSEVFRVVAPGGLVLVSVPGHQSLFSDYDHAVGTRRRYSRKRLRDILERNGFVVDKVAGVFGFLVPYAFLTRRIPYLLGKRRNRDDYGKVASTAANLPRFIDKILERWALFEFLAGSPWGLSIFAVATTPKGTFDMKTPAEGVQDGSV